MHMKSMKDKQKENPRYLSTSLLLTTCISFITIIGFFSTFRTFWHNELSNEHRIKFSKTQSIICINGFMICLLCMSSDSYHSDVERMNK